jgi:hypothetical protein
VRGHRSSDGREMIAGLDFRAARLLIKNDNPVLC